MQVLSTVKNPSCDRTLPDPSHSSHLNWRSVEFLFGLVFILAPASTPDDLLSLDRRMGYVPSTIGFPRFSTSRITTWRPVVVSLVALESICRNLRIKGKIKGTLSFVQKFIANDCFTRWTWSGRNPHRPFSKSPFQGDLILRSSAAFGSRLNGAC